MLMPKFMLPNVHALTDDFLAAQKIGGIIFDIDNTLVGFREPRPTPEVLALLEHLREKGIQVAIASNNKEERVKTFAEGLGLSAYHRSAKPLGFVLRRIRKEFGLPAKQIALVGDQIYTDMLGGNLAGMITVLVDPIDTKETRLFRFKRRMEMPIINRKRRKDEKQK
ncbi:MAG: YqeG family HAD IIIA-type phosphatase [Clostridia bacterium]|nr:YqeG family HAD IIIA-type phosphatase [Clostridia bacterium]